MERPPKKKVVYNDDQDFGRPTKYRPEYCQMLVDHMASGWSYESFSAEINTVRTTLYNWEKQYPDFLYAKKMGKEKLLFFYEKKAADLIDGKITGNAAVFIFSSKNKIGWTDKQEIAQETNKTITLKYSLDNTEKLNGERKELEE